MGAAAALTAFQFMSLLKAVRARLWKNKLNAHAAVSAHQSNMTTRHRRVSVTEDSAD